VEEVVDAFEAIAQHRNYIEPKTRTIVDENFEK